MRKQKLPTKIKACIVCDCDFFTFGASGCKSYLCRKDSCRQAFLTFVPAPNRQLVQPGSVTCYRNGCSGSAPAGVYPKGQKQLFCSFRCNRVYSSKGSRLGICKNCKADIIGMPCQRNKKFCNEKCWVEYRNITSFNEKAGEFASILIAYLNGDGKNRYKLSTWRGVRANLAVFFHFVREQGVTELSGVTPSIMTAFIARERATDLQQDNYISQISVFFNWCRRTVSEDILNPVLPDWHSQRQSQPRPRPYSDAEVETYCRLLEGNPRLRLAFAIALESGLRVSETANVRISDINRGAQQIHVRLPTKNMRARISRFREMTVTALKEWGGIRDPRCEHDFLLHNTWLARFKTPTLCQFFTKYFERVTGLPSTFSYHRLRHTWACTLLNAGIDPLVLMELGGWTSCQSMQFLYPTPSDHDRDLLRDRCRDPSAASE